MDKVRKFKEREIEGKLKVFIAQGIVYSVAENTNVRLIRYVYFNGTREIEIEYAIGNEVPKKITFYEHDLDAKLLLFKPKKEVTLTFAPKAELIKAEVKKTINNQTNILEMSTETQNNLKGLRNHLFEAIRKLEGGTMRADEAKAMAGLAQTIINSAKVEMEYKLLITDKPNIGLLEE